MMGTATIMVSGLKLLSRSLGAPLVVMEEPCEVWMLPMPPSFI